MMRFGVPYKSVALFLGITMVLFAKSKSESNQYLKRKEQPYTLNYDTLHLLSNETTSIGGKKLISLKTTPITTETVANQSNDPASQYSSNLRQADSKILSLPSQNQVNCEPLRPSHFVREIVEILSPEIFSQADPFRYLVHKTMKLRPNRVGTYGKLLRNHLNNDDFPPCYVSYAKALFSLFRCWLDVNVVNIYVSGIRTKISKNDADLSFLPSDVSVPPQLLELFSGEIFGDPTPPQRLFYKLIDMPKSDLLNLRTQLQKFIDRTKKDSTISYPNRDYIWYADAVWTFLKNESAIDDLKRDMAEIQPLATSEYNFSSAESTK